MSDYWEIKAVSKDQCSWNFAALCAQNWDAVLVLSVFCLATRSLIKSARIFCKTDVFFQNPVIANLPAAFPLTITIPGTRWAGGISVSSAMSPQVKEEEQSANHTLMIQETLQQASVELSEQHHLVVSSDEVEGIETVTVYTQGGEASEFIVYVQEAVQPVEEQTVEESVQEL